MDYPYPIFYYHSRLYRVKIKTILIILILTLIQFIIFAYIFYQLFHINKTVDYVERITGEDIFDNISNTTNIVKTNNNVSINNSTTVVQRIKNEKVQIMSTRISPIESFSIISKRSPKRNDKDSPKYKIFMNTTIKSITRLKTGKISNKIHSTPTSKPIVNITRIPQGRLAKFSILLIKSKKKFENGYGLILSNGTVNRNDNNHSGKVCRRRDYVYRCKKIKKYVSICKCRLNGKNHNKIL